MVKPNEIITKELSDEITNYISDSEIAQIKGLIWKKSVEFLIVEYHIDNTLIFDMMEKDIRENLDENCLTGSLQDAFVEFRLELKELINTNV